MKPDMKKVTEFEDASGKRFRKTTHADAKKYTGAVRKTYESAKDVLSFGDFVPVDAKPVEPAEPKAKAGV